MNDIVWKSFKVVPTEGDWQPASYSVCAKMRNASDGRGLWRWPVSLTSMQRDAPTRVIACTTLSGEAYCQAGEMVQ
jgi:hypothetical protein